MLKNVLYVLAAILMLFVVSNPTPEELKAYLGRSKIAGLKREFNLFVCSQYSVGRVKYFAVAGSFFTIHNSKK
jgi:hypothetical protein